MIDSVIGSDVSRRSLVKTAATAAAVGGALVLAGPATAAQAAAAPGQAPAARTPGTGQDGDRGVMVRVLDAHLGTLEIFTATGQHTITDRTLAAHLASLGR